MARGEVADALLHPRLPPAGEARIFDRSRYTPRGAERFTGSCAEDHVERSLREAPGVDTTMVAPGTLLLEHWLEAEQTLRLPARIDDGRQTWNQSPMDLNLYGRCDDHSSDRDEMLAAPHTAWTPWMVADANDNRLARLHIIRQLLDLVPHEPTPVARDRPRARESMASAASPIGPSAGSRTGTDPPMLARPCRVRRAVVAFAAIVAGLVPACSSAPTASPDAVERLQGCGVAATHRYRSVADVDPAQTSVDVMTPPAGSDGCAERPLVLWVHGGGWTEGDKSEYTADKVRLFNDAGYVFASTNYRLTDPTLEPPHPQHPVHDEDVAAALAWLVDHAPELGIDAERVAVLGHSAGGGITAAVSTDERFLAAHDLSLDTITCAGSMDGEGYDVTAGATTAPEGWRPTYTTAFGTDPAVWEDASPINHVAADKGIPRFFVAARGVDWRVEQHLAFIDALRRAGVEVTALDTRALEHADLTTVIGSPDDTVVTPALMDFLRGCFTD